MWVPRCGARIRRRGGSRCRCRCRRRGLAFQGDSIPQGRGKPRRVVEFGQSAGRKREIVDPDGNYGKLGLRLCMSSCIRERGRKERNQHRPNECCMLCLCLSSHSSHSSHSLSPVRTSQRLTPAYAASCAASVIIAPLKSRAKNQRQGGKDYAEEPRRDAPAREGTDISL